MLRFLSNRIGTSLRLRLLAASVILVALALAVAAISFERAARDVVVDAIHSHLEARAQEVHEAVARFQRERALTVRNWAETEAMQLTLDSRDPKFAEDYLRRTIQDQGGAIAAAALLSDQGKIVAAVRAAPATERRGVALPEVRDRQIDAGLVAAARGVEIVVTLASRTTIDPQQAAGDTVFVIAPIKDFVGDLVGFVAATLEPEAFQALLAEVNGHESAYRPVITDRQHRLVLSLPGASAGLPWPAEAKLGAPGQLERLAVDGVSSYGVRTASDPAAPGWSAIMMVPQRYAEGRVQELRMMLALLFVAVLVGAVVTATFAIRQAAKPLSDVTRSMARVAGGDLTTRLEEAYTDELGHLVRSFNTMVSEVARSHDELQRTEALRKEVQIAHRIQTAILPVSPAVRGFEVAARMKPADDVGGDLYDILAFDDEVFWVLIGDVSGHGINSGLVMMMAQVAAYGAIADDPRCSPRDVIAAVNRVLHENVRKRMGRDDYLTLMAARHTGDGRFVAAGAHQPVFLGRTGGTVDVIEPVGPWCGLTDDLDGRVHEFEFRVAHGETLCLITDGIVEAQDEAEQLFGEERLSEVVAETAGLPATQALSTLFSRVEAFAKTQSDDMTAVVLRRIA